MNKNKIVGIVLFLIVGTISTLSLWFGVASFFQAKYEEALGAMLTTLSGMGGLILGNLIGNKENKDKGEKNE